MNWRIKSIDAILETAEQHRLHRSLGPIQLMMLGIGSVIGTGIFVLTSDAAQTAGPAMLISFVVSAFVCATTALCYAELAAMVPVSGSAYTYSYAVLGELVAWVVGWALVLEYAVSASAVAVGWSGYLVGLLEHSIGLKLPAALIQGPYAGGIINLPAVFISLLCTALLIRGTRESAVVNTTLVCVKIAALGLFVVLAVPALKSGNFHPFAPLGAHGVVSAAASIFFAYVGFDAVSTAAEETRDPQRNIPIGLIGSLAVCTVIYIVVAGVAIGVFGGQPVAALSGGVAPPGSIALAQACTKLAAHGAVPLVCSNEALAHVLREIGHPFAAGVLGFVAFLTLPTVILTMVYGQTRIFFVMARDGLLPAVFCRIHARWKTPHLVTMLTGAIITGGSAFLPVGQLADISNSGTLFAFFVVAVAVLVLRVRAPGRRRSFRTPLVWVTAPVAMAGCVVLFAFLPPSAKLLFPVWTAIGLVFYGLYGVRRSRFAAVT